VSRLVLNTNYLAFSPATVIGQVSNVAFDAATFEIWGALLNGGRLEILEDETILRAGRLAEAIAERGVTTMFLTAALFNQAAHAKADAFSGLHTLLVGGDVADPTTCGLVLAAGPPTRLVNVYGPTEATTFAAFHEVRSVPADATSIPIGRPIANTTLYVLGPHMQPEAIGIPGELYIGGPGVARGYVKLPELTSKRFVLDPFSDKRGAVLYRSGDRARFLADGTIEWLGRIDRQVKVRGFRVEPAEIEAALLRHAHVAEAAVVVVEGDSGSRRLVGYLARRSNDPVLDSDLRHFLRETLPDFMIPDSFVWLERLPLTPNGKIDRSALPHEPTGAPRREIAPRTPTERAVASIWAEHLGLVSVGIDDDFFDLGGHSLLAVKLVTALELKFGLSLPLALLFEAPTVSALARAIDGRKAGTGSTRVINIQARGRRTPIFALPGGGGSVIVYGLLARALGTSQPFYGLEHPGLDDGEVPPDRVESVAAGFVEDMQRQAPNQPCILMGACSGAIVAFELARLLEEAGRCVELVIMLDPSRIGRRRSAAMTGPLWRRLAVLRFVAGRLASYVREFSRLEGAGRWDFVKEKRARLATLLRQPDTLRDSVRHLKRDRIREATVAALYRYVPRPYGGPVALIPGERFDSSGHGKSGSDWHSLCSGPLEVLRMPGMTSGEMLRPPLLEHLVRHLRDLLDHNVPARFDVERRLQPPRTRARKRALYGETRIALVAASDKGRDDGFGYSCRVTVIGRFLFLGPILVLFAWFAAGQWDLAGPETRAWLQFTGIVCVASLIPLPGASWSPSVLAARVRWWGWVVVAGLLVAS
jgi:thioesterase domain-containing protein/acyl carrier protein